jgi:hypothetical protein
MRPTFILLSSFLIAGCEAIPETALATRFDQDGDGFEAIQFGGDDCDDSNRDIHPGAVEVCDGIDNDCSGDVDSDALDRRIWYRDSDLDGYGSPSTETPANTCFPPDGFVGDATDCNDDLEQGGAEINPQTVWYRDEDGDGYGDPESTVVTCIQLPQLVGNAEDCDDDDPDLHPETEWWEDADGDGFGDPTASVQACWVQQDVEAGFVRAAATLADCNDAVAHLYPGAAGAEEDPNLCAIDLDGDGFGDWDPSVAGAEPGTDCDDTSSEVYPGAVELWWDDALNDCGSTVNTMPIDGAYQTISGGAIGNTLGKTVLGVGNAISCHPSHPSCDTEIARPDFLIAAPGESSHSASNGAVHLIDGADPGAYVISFVGTSDINRLGTSLAAPGDLDGDGQADFIIGSQDDYAWVIFSHGVGVASAYNLGTSHRSMFVTLYKAEEPGDQLGFAVAGIGSFTGDGTPDIAMGAHQSSASGDGIGRVYVFPDPGYHTTVDLQQIRADQSVKEAEDLATRDTGLDPGETDSETEFSEGGFELEDVVPPPIWVIEPEPDGAGGAFGWAVAGANDLNGDGMSDMAIGAPGASYAGVGSGRLYIALGEREESSGDTGEEGDGDEGTGFIRDLYAEDFHRIDGLLEGDRLGSSIAGIGDFNGDGYDDLAVAATGTAATPTPGRVYIIFGSETVTGVGELPFIHVVADVTIEPNDDLGVANFGAAISAAGPMLSVPTDWIPGDLDHDGMSDLLIGSPKSPMPSYGAGHVYLVYGGITGTWDITDLVGVPAADVEMEGGQAGLTHTGATFEGEANYTLGYSVSGVGDLTGDGWPDMLMGAPGADLTGTSAGSTFIVAGSER